MQACDGLRALHNHHCIWGDVKPENIFLSEGLGDGMFKPSSEARIGGVGLSKRNLETLLADTANVGCQPVSRRYCPPESFQGSDRENFAILKASDIYSFGNAFYETNTIITSPTTIFQTGSC